MPTPHARRTDATPLAPGIDTTLPLGGWGWVLRSSELRARHVDPQYFARFDEASNGFSHRAHVLVTANPLCVKLDHQPVPLARVARSACRNEVALEVRASSDERHHVIDGRREVRAVGAGSPLPQPPREQLPALGHRQPGRRALARSSSRAVVITGAEPLGHHRAAEAANGVAILLAAAVGARW